MNKAKLKSYAPQARKDFIAAVTARANQLGLSDKAGTLEVAPSQPQGDITVIAGQAWPIKVEGQRQRLIARLQKDGFEHTLEAVAYTWFNRFAAIRYMELHDYLGHGHRALSSTAGGLPDILAYATELAQGGHLPGLKAPLVLEMKLAGNRDGELYRALLVAQCNALSNAMPFLFERIDDDSELLLPDNLLRSDSVIAKLVEAIPEEDWAEVEVIGWLYQFYISEKKDQVIGKVVKSEDIPAATQLFTPNWIVQYLVQNSVGRLWLMANPHSTLAQAWPYYITPAEQTPEVQAQLDALIQTRINEDATAPGSPTGNTPGVLNPETITVLDPACGSGHILVVAYDVLKAIYLERGYQPRAIPRLILEKNLFGLDIDDRAAQMAGFALLMKARADDRRLFTTTDEAGNPQPPKLNVLSLQSSQGLSAPTLAAALAALPESKTALADWGSDPNSGQDLRGHQQSLTDLGSDPQWAGQTTTNTNTDKLRTAIATLINTFTHAKTFGSLIQISPQTHIDVLKLLLIVKQAHQTGDLYAQAAAQDLLPLLQQARVLAMQFDAVVANPPYMGNKGMNPALKDYAKVTFPDSKSDLFAMFMERAFGWCKPSGYNSMVTMQSWMFLSTFQSMREALLNNKTLNCMVHMGNGVMGIAFGTAATVVLNTQIQGHESGFSYCGSNDVDTDGKPRNFPIENDRLKNAKQSDFTKIPGSPVAYWISKKIQSLFSNSRPLEDICTPRVGLGTTDNAKFVRSWSEISWAGILIGATDRSEAKNSKKKWFPYNKGGAFRRWYGNNEYVINWRNDGQDVKKHIEFKNPNVARGESHYFREGVTWGLITSSAFSCRYMAKGFIFDVGGSSGFPPKQRIEFSLAFLNSNLAQLIIKCLNPTVNTQVGDLQRLPVLDLSPTDDAELNQITRSLVDIYKKDWDACECSWEFHGHPLIGIPTEKSLPASYAKFVDTTFRVFEQAHSLEESANALLNHAYGLHDELTATVPESQITLARADREKDSQRLISYAIGCMMGRYSLDEPGLIYAHAGNVGFDPSRYATFPADADGIVPLTDELWFADDAPSRIREFLRAVWGPDTLEENMAWLAESLGKKSAKEASETPEETIRRYIADKFFKDHLQTYKKRPIYWLFSSGKQGAFQALVYLHRYSEGTLARLRAEYVVPLTGKIQSRIEMLQKDANAASSTPSRNKLAKEVEKLKKKHVELLAYDEQLRHYADMRITLDLDDGVKVNYGKFGDLLAEVKAITGGVGDD